MGNLTRDPELRYTPNGQAVTSFSIATNRRWNDASGETKDAVEFTDVVAWGKMAENIANYMKKGRRVHVTGRLQTRNWEAQDGTKRNKTEVIANDVIFMDRAGAGTGPTDGVDAVPVDDFSQAEKEDSGKKGKKPASPSQGGKEEKPEEEINIEDIPF